MRTGRKAILVLLPLLVAACDKGHPRSPATTRGSGGGGGNSGSGGDDGEGGQGGSAGGAKGSNTGGSKGSTTKDASASADVRAVVDAMPDRTREVPANLPPAQASGLVGYWTFDKAGGTVAEDRSGSLNEGMLMTGATLVAGGFPSAMFANPGALSLDGVMSRVVLGTNRFPDVNGSKTVSFWFNQAAMQMGTRDFISFMNAAALCGVQVGVRGGKLAVWGWGGNNALILTAPDPAPAPGDWHQLTYTFDGTTHALILDGGAPVTATTAPQTCEVTDAMVGSYPGGKENFGGLIDDLRVYTRALSAAEIDLLAKGGEPTPLSGKDAGADAASDARATDAQAAKDAAKPRDAAKAGDTGKAGDAAAATKS